ncbi:Cell cycle arrest protein BUB3 [Nakaseomyces bracarensis]|uniref:Cell cycle arrest protein BUB3 n=1 Tax=Nakaseomyces bracarensis TaxID=273131 RepID=A0ABR4NPK6_9SACH
MRYELESVPNDYISSLELIDELDQLVVTSWNGSLNIYKINYQDKNCRLVQTVTASAPILSSCYLRIDSSYYLYIGTIDGEVFKVDLDNGVLESTKNQIARNGISGLCRYGSKLIAGSWDGYLQLINPSTNTVDMSTQLPTKCFSMSINNNILLVASTQCKVLELTLPLVQDAQCKIVDSGQVFQIRDIVITPEGDGFVCTGIDGRVSVEFFNQVTERFAFRCHKYNLEDTVMAYPVNAIKFIPNTDTFFTGGSDGCVSAWHLKKKTKTRQLDKFNENSVVKLACNSKVLCVATSDDSFKTNAVIDENIELEPSRVYLEFL